jgi:hypothetical protein
LQTEKRDERAEGLLAEFVQPPDILRSFGMNVIRIDVTIKLEIS